jgi:hypothetical protein
MIRAVSAGEALAGIVTPCRPAGLDWPVAAAGEPVPRPGDAECEAGSDATLLVPAPWPPLLPHAVSVITVRAAMIAATCCLLPARIRMTGSVPAGYEGLVRTMFGSGQHPPGPLTVSL